MMGKYEQQGDPQRGGFDMSNNLAFKVLKWQSEFRVGISSATMASIACGLESNFYGSQFNPPLDPEDLRRCMDLVNEIPEIRGYFPIIAAKVSEFGPILKYWDELVSMLRDEMATGSGRAPRTYDFMIALRDSNQQEG